MNSVHMLLLATLKVEVTRDWVPIILQGAGVLITLLAVGVALFGPGLRERLKQPRLTLGYEYDHEASLICLTVENHPHKNTAEDVEIYVLEVHHPPWNAPPTPGASSVYNASIQRPLRWLEPQDSVRQTVPTGFRRRCEFIHYVARTSESDLECTLGVWPQRRRIDQLWIGDVSLDNRIAHFQEHPEEQEQPATIRVAIAGRNLKTMHYNVLVTYMPVKRGMYEKPLDYAFRVRFEDAPTRLEPWSDKRRRRHERIATARFTLRRKPLPNQSVIGRYLDRRMEGKPDLSESAIQRTIKRWRGW